MKLKLALISDIGGPIASSTSFYYNIGSSGKGYVPTNSFGPGPEAVSALVQSWGGSDVIAVGDLSYNASSSTTLDASVGAYYNNFIYPYPAPPYLAAPYTTINQQAVLTGQRAWPYNIYNYPKGFPAPLGGQQGGSPDQRNHFWGSLGNHDYGEAIGYGQVNVTPYNFSGEDIGPPLGPSSSTSLESFLDYVTPFLANPALLGVDRARLRIGAVDRTGNRGAYYSIGLGGSPRKPLVEFFMLDTERLNINAGFEKWNPTGTRIKSPNGVYKDAVPTDRNHSLIYDPSKPTSPAAAGTSTDPFNGYAQYQWLKSSLASSNARWKVVTGHHPVYASGRWSDRQPDDHMSNLYVQRLLKALPKGSFDAYYNGHDHFYERVLESNDKGIGLGIPFITNGNSGRNLSRKIQVPYGTSVYEPTEWDTKQDRRHPDVDKSINPNKGPAWCHLLQSGPLVVGSQGFAGNGTEDTKGNTRGLYGYGFGATKLESEKNYLLFQYQEASVVDPAIANHLPGGLHPERGFAGTVASDWIPDPCGQFNGLPDLARFEFSVNEAGAVSDVKVLHGGRGYMSSKGGNYTVKGFNVYGNNVDLKKPWKETAQVDLVFADGMLKTATLRSPGQGYSLAVQAAAGRNDATSSEGLTGDQTLKVPINYNIAESQYLVRDEQLYNDWYLIADTRSVVTLMGQPGQPGQLKVTVRPQNKHVRDLLHNELQPTTAYTGEGSQRFTPRAQNGDVVVYNKNHKEIAKGSLSDGVWLGSVERLPRPSDPVYVSFSGDPITSYNINFKPSSLPAHVRVASAELPNAGAPLNAARPASCSDQDCAIPSLFPWTASDSGTEPDALPWSEPAICDPLA